MAVHSEIQPTGNAFPLMDFCIFDMFVPFGVCMLCLYIFGISLNHWLALQKSYETNLPAGT